jgi:DNA sulfur modification protein DndB
MVFMRGVQRKTKISDDSNNFTFNALRGIQGGREYYVVMCPLKWIPSIFRFNEPEIPPELRSQRVLNKARIPEITSYLINNHQEYVFSSLTASIDGDIEFVPAGKNGGSLKMGKLLVPMDSRFLINDGQHRRAAIEEAIKRKPELELETISVVFYLDRGLKNSQQMFSDLNKFAIRPTKSLNILYDNRDDFSTAIIDLLSKVPIFDKLTDLEKTSISNRTTKVFTLNSIFAANKALLGKKDKKPEINDDEKQLATEFWNQVYTNIKEWQEIVEGKTTPYDLRKEYVHVQGILLHAIGMVGHALIQKYPKSWKSKLKVLNKIDWRRSNKKDWEGRAMIGGRLSKNYRNIVLTNNILKKKVGLPLTSKEKEYENDT